MRYLINVEIDDFEPIQCGAKTLPEAGQLFKLLQTNRSVRRAFVIEAATARVNEVYTASAPADPRLVEAATLLRCCLDAIEGRDAADVPTLLRLANVKVCEYLESQ